jgi:23S rRNA (adenine2503-C2)-methyltransferase
VASEISKDKAIKYLFRSDSGKKYETVFIPDGKRNTVCVSTQSGCRMGCAYCATASYGFSGDLTAGEIVNQIIAIPQADIVTHVVFMGMGEPMDNTENVLKACGVITAEWGLSMSPRNVTVSSVGITPSVREFLVRSECNFTLSLHSPFIDERRSIAPAEKVYPFKDILELMKGFPLRKKRRFSISYVMIENLNDTDMHLAELKDILHGSMIRVNLLPYHPTGKDQKRSSPEEKMQYFKHQLVISGISASIRKSRGSDIHAACGLLAVGRV